MKRYFLGLSANYTRKQRIAHIFAVGKKKDYTALQDFLSQKYNGEAILTKNGRSALALTLKAYFKPGDGVIVNGFTCYAVYEAVRSAKLKPIFADISREDLNFSIKTIEDAIKRSGPTAIRGIIIQNTLGNPVDITAISKFAKKHDLILIEDLAHCAGIKYRDGREAGTVGVATALSFGKDKSVDTISGGAVIFRQKVDLRGFEPYLRPLLSDSLRARFYPLFGTIARGLSYIHLGGALMRLLIKIHWVERSADNKLDLKRRISKFEAKLALAQLKSFKKAGEKPLREFYLVNNRDEVIKKLKKAGFFFDGFWYERPVSPERYYKKVHFPEESCPIAVEVSQQIINFPTHYSKEALEPARKIIKNYLEEK